MNSSVPSALPEEEREGASDRGGGGDGGETRGSGAGSSPATSASCLRCPDPRHTTPWLAASSVEVEARRIAKERVAVEKLAGEAGTKRVAEQKVETERVAEEKTEAERAAEEQAEAVEIVSARYKF